jgi:hypothetical protein
VPLNGTSRCDFAREPWAPARDFQALSLLAERHTGQSGGRRQAQAAKGNEGNTLAMGDTQARRLLEAVPGHAD